MQSTETIDAFNAANYDDFDRVVQSPITLHDIEQKIHQQRYRTAGEFTADFKWLLHNCYVYFSTCYTPPTETGAILKIAKSLLKTCKQEMGQIDTCAECYANANSKKNWFVEVCEPPHVLLWAKLKGFPYWPAKAMAVNGATLVDVRFFGAHDRAWVPAKDCYLYSQHNPNVYKLKNTTILQCIKEIEQHIAKVRVKYGGFEYGPAKEKYDPLRHAEQLRTMVPGYQGEESMANCNPVVSVESMVASSNAVVMVNALMPVTTISSGSGSSAEVVKTNLTYKIIKTGDNSCLIAPVVKEGGGHKNGQSAVEGDANLNNSSNNNNKRRRTTPPTTVATSSSVVVIDGSTAQKATDQVSTNLSTSVVTPREAIKPTKIVLKSCSSSDHKQYELVTPTPSEEEKKKGDLVGILVDAAGPQGIVIGNDATAGSAPAGETRKVAAVVMKRKSDKWTSAVLRGANSNNKAGGDPKESSREASPKKEPEIIISKTPSNNVTSPMPVDDQQQQHPAKDMKRRHTEEVTTTTTSTIPVSAIPNKIKIRRVTRASSRPLVDELLVLLKDEAINQSAAMQLSKGTTSEGRGESSRLEKSEEKEEKKEEGSSVEQISIDVDPEDVQERGGEEDAEEGMSSHSNNNNLMNKPPITTVRDVLDQLPQISIVPSRKNSTCRVGGGSDQSRVSSRSSSKSSVSKEATTTGGNSAKTSPAKPQQRQVDSQVGALLVPENLHVKIEPISDDDEVEITVNGSGRVNNNSNDNNNTSKNKCSSASGSGSRRERSVEILEDNSHNNNSSSGSGNKGSGNNNNNKLGTSPAQPRARKTFARNIGTRPKPPQFNAGQVNNMVLIPREGLSGEQGGQQTMVPGIGIGNPNITTVNSSVVVVPTAAAEMKSARNERGGGSSSRQSPVHMLSGTITPNLAAAVTSMIAHGPPRLVRKPSGTLQSSGDVIFPSEAGSSCRILMENAHKMTDFFRSVIEDTLSDMADKGCLEAKVQLLQLELEKQRYNHQKEMAELKSNTGEWYSRRCIYCQIYK